MENKVENILEKYKGKTAGIFVDEANLFYSQKELGWHIDWQKFSDFLNNFCKIEIKRYYMGMPLDKKAYEQNILIKNRIERSGFQVITKPIKKIYLDNKKIDFKNKCNFDVEITKDVIRNLEKVDLVFVASGDSDFVALRNDIIYNKKGFIFICFERNVAWEIRKSYHVFFDDIRNDIEYKK
ncbi:MAG: NYN domain-containing protein [Candidatus Staskawiczbacteria bacterium]|nr:NYN domain-containing protein [Candidatus Staskawiczbacteria bacterium]